MYENKTFSNLQNLMQARRKQLGSGAAKAKEILENPTAEGFLFFYFKKSNLDRKKALRRKPTLPQCFSQPWNESEILYKFQI